MGVLTKTDSHYNCEFCCNDKLNNEPCKDSSNNKMSEDITNTQVLTNEGGRINLQKEAKSFYKKKTVGIVSIVILFVLSIVCSIYFSFKFEESLYTFLTISGTILLYNIPFAIVLPLQYRPPLYLRFWVFEDNIYGIKSISKDSIIEWNYKINGSYKTLGMHDKMTPMSINEDELWSKGLMLKEKYFE